MSVSFAWVGGSIRVSTFLVVILFIEGGSHFLSTPHQDKVTLSQGTQGTKQTAWRVIEIIFFGRKVLSSLSRTPPNHEAGISVPQGSSAKIGSLKAQGNTWILDLKPNWAQYR